MTRNATLRNRSGLLKTNRGNCEDVVANQATDVLQLQQAFASDFGSAFGCLVAAASRKSAASRRKKIAYPAMLCARKRTKPLRAASLLARSIAFLARSKSMLRPIPST